MKDSQQTDSESVGKTKYINENNERFSTVEGLTVTLP